MPPAASTRARYDARPMWPPSRLRSAASASIPRPSSATSRRALPRSCERVTVAEVASACLTTLLSSSLAAAYSRPSTEVAELVAPTVELDRDRRPPGGRRRVGELAQGARQAGVLEHGRMQLRRGGAQQPRALRERKLQAGERLGVGTLAGVLEVMPRPQQVLQRAVVQTLGEHPALAILGAHQLPDQVGAILEQVTDRQHPRALNPRQGYAAQADAEQHPRAQRHRAPRLGVGLPGGDAHAEVHADRRCENRRADARRQLGRGQDGHEQEPVDEHVSRPALAALRHPPARSPFRAPRGRRAARPTPCAAPVAPPRQPHAAIDATHAAYAPATM